MSTWNWQRAVKWLHQAGRSGVTIKHGQEQGDFLDQAITALHHCAQDTAFDKETLEALFHTWLKLKIRTLPLL